VLLTLLSCLLAASTWRIYSNTWDEPEHLAAGIELLDRGRYEYDTEHPPLARIMMALGPYLAGAHSYGTPPPDGVQEGVDILYTEGH
jgi:dolichyl-phosphate-mannose--protein O-mannosyl transferase